MIPLLIKGAFVAFYSFMFGRYSFKNRKKYSLILPILIANFIWMTYLFISDNLFKIFSLQESIYLLFVGISFFLLGRIRRFYGGYIAFEGNTQYMKNIVIEFRQGEIYFNKGLGDSQDMKASYKAYSKIVEIIKNPRRFLFLGGGGCTAPLYFLKKYPHVFIDIVEIDGTMIELVKKYCGLNNPRVTFYNESARNFINSCQSKYELIFLDIVQGIIVSKKILPNIQKENTYIIHEHFCTYTFESLSKIKQLLYKNGFLIINELGTLGKKINFWQYIHTNLTKLFSFVLVFPKHYTQISRFQNIILLAGNSSFLKNKQMLQKAIYNSKLLDEDKFQILALTANEYSHKKTGGTNLLLDRDFEKWHFQHTP